MIARSEDAIDISHRDIHPAFLFRSEHLDDVRIVEAGRPPPALKPRVEDHVTFELDVGNLIATVSPLRVSIALKMEAIPLRAITSVNWY